MATNKITKRDNFNTLLTIEAVKANPVLVDFITHEIDLLDRKNTKNGEKKVNEKMVSAKQTVIDYLASVDSATVRDVMGILGTDSSQYATSVLTQMVRVDGTAKREVIKGKSHYSLA